MPIRLLKQIKLKRTSCSRYPVENKLLRRTFVSKHILGAYLFSCKDLEANQPLFNDGIPSLILMPRSCDVVRLKSGQGTHDLTSSWVCCGVIQNTHWEIPPELEYILIIRFKPASFYSIFGVDPQVLRSNPVCSLQDVVSDDWHRILEVFYEKQTLQEKVEYLNKVFSAHHADDYLPGLLQEAINYVDEKKGNIRVENLLHAFKGKVNPRWLHRNFIKYVGISPKKYISLQRFIYAYGTYDPETSSDLSALALNSGYYDYDHFSKDFKQFLGVAPSKYRWA